MGNRTSVTVAEMSVHLAGGTADEERLLRRTFGRGARWLRHSPDAWCRAGLSKKRAERLSQLVGGHAAQIEMDRARALGIELVTHSHESFPTAFRNLSRPPVLVAVRGRWPPAGPRLAIVGSRATTPYGSDVTRRLARAATEAGWAIVSGLARGVDRIAHETCLAHGGWPLGVLGNGIDVTYPAEHRQLQGRVATEGTLISDFPLGMRPDRHHFPRRNRLIAALASHVLVVEAGRRSGALITAGMALDLGHEVLAVPGPVDGPMSEGTNRLLYDGAAPVLDEETLITALGTDPPRTCGNAEETEIGDARPDVDALRRALGQSSRTADDLARLLGWTPRVLRSRLITLELEGRVTRRAGDRYAWGTQR